MKLRTHLLLLVLAIVVPAGLFAGALIVYNAQLHRESIEQGMRDTSRALAIALDRDIRDIKTAVRTLATSRLLDSPADLRRFADEAATVSRSFGGWAVLSDVTGHQLINTTAPFGAPLPAPSPRSLEMMREVVARREAFVSDVFIGTVSRRPAVIIAVPVIRDGEVRYVLDFPFEPVRFTGLLEEAALSPGWIGVIVDRSGGIVARVPDGTKFVAQKVPAWSAATRQSDGGFVHGRILSDAEIHAAYNRSRESGWVVGVGAPVTVIEAGFRRVVLLLSAGGLALLALACGLAFVLAKRLATPITQLADALKMPADGARAWPAGGQVTEVDELRAALVEATDLRAAGETLREADRRKDDFLATLSHELRNPLNAMLGWLRLLRSGRLDAGGAQRALDVIERSVSQQSRLIADLLDTSRIIAGKLTLRMEHVDWPGLVGAVVESARPGFEAKAVTLTSLLASDAGAVHGDPERLRQVVENLLSNALKFTGPNGAVTVTLARAEAGRVRLSLSDTGKGIAAEFLPYVFDRFRQADSTSTRTQTGLGLGLAIVRFVVDAHGGSARAHSPGLGQGATFTVDLPIAAAADALPAPADRPAAAASLDGLRVLVVEDDDDTRELVAMIVAHNGAVPTPVRSVREALTALRQTRADVLVCDIAMPDDDGLTLIREVRSWPEASGGRTPAVAVTAFARAEDRDIILSAGFQAHLAKPVEPTELVRAVAALAGTRR
jgi:signal transduction histidine kinase/CheY-like chemotaxis protein